MPKIVVQIIAGAVALLILVGVVMWVVGLGPFNTRPSAAAKAAPKVQATVAKTQTQVADAVAKAEDKTQAAGAVIEKRTEAHVAKIRAVPRVAAPNVPDRQFFVGVCESQLYAGSPDCRGFGGEPEGGRSGLGSRSLQGR